MIRGVLGKFWVSVLIYQNCSPIYKHMIFIAFPIQNSLISSTLTRSSAPAPILLDQLMSHQTFDHLHFRLVKL